MASTVTLQNTVDWARTFTKLMPIVSVGGFTNEPAISICNQVLQELLSPPYNWKWNRVELADFDTVDKTQDYTISTLSDVGWLEQCIAELKSGTSTPKPRREIEVVRDLPLTSVVESLTKICKLKEVTTTTVFRTWPIPSSEIETIKLVYQKKPVIKVLLTETWTPVPDELQWVVRQGFLAWALKHADDNRAEREMATFYGAIARALGLHDMERRHEGLYPDRSILMG